MDAGGVAAAVDGVVSAGADGVDELAASGVGVDGVGVGELGGADGSGVVRLGRGMPVIGVATVGGRGEGRPRTRGLHSFTFQLNVSAFCGIGRSAFWG
jgi:hypothetical protein